MSVANYTFLPWYRTGLGAAVASSDGARAVAPLSLLARMDGVEEPINGPRVTLIGPGDLIGIDDRARIRVDPAPGTLDFEPNYLATIEFFDEDFVWRYSPRPATDGGSRMFPWISLIVLADDDGYQIVDGPAGLPRKVIIRDAAILPPAEQAWAWVHAHLSDVEVADPPVPRATATAIANNPAASCSRLIAARHLQPQRGYRALVVPTFDSGRRAGLGLDDGGGDALAWGRSGPVELPIYHEWTFRTGENGDFKELAFRLNGQKADPSVGRRPMDVSRPLEHAPLPPILSEGETPIPVLDLEGALSVPGATPSTWEANSRREFSERLAALINLGDAWQLGAHNVEGEPPLPAGLKLPVVLPPSYGRSHAGGPPLDAGQATSRWLEEINLDPRNRVAAAFGTLVVQKNQEDFMARAWKQFGELFDANRLRDRAQLYREVLTAIDTKHLRTLPDEHLLAVTGATHARIKDPGQALTVRGQIDASALPGSTVQPSLRRTLRANGPIAKRFDIAGGALGTLIRDVAMRHTAVSPARLQPSTRLSFSAARLDAAVVVTPQVQQPGPEVSVPGIGPVLVSPPVLRVDPVIAAGGVQVQIQRLSRATVAAGAVAGPTSGATAALAVKTTVASVATPVAVSTPASGLALGVGVAQAPILAVVPAGVETTLRSSTLLIESSALTSVASALNWEPSTIPAAALRSEDMLVSEANASFSFVAWNFRSAALASTELLALALPQTARRPALDVPSTVTLVRTALDPGQTVAARVSAVTHLPSGISPGAYDALDRITAHPRFEDASVYHLQKLSQDYVVPNLAALARNSITLLTVNWRFIESLMVGLNHEMARELLWRGYPTDQRGSYFRSFWDARVLPGALDGQGRIKAEYLDIHPIHGWRSPPPLRSLRPLGVNRPQEATKSADLVLAIRGDLLRRYPNTHVYAHRAVALSDAPPHGFESSMREPAHEGQPDAEREPILFARFEPDIYCFGFDLSATEARGGGDDQGWYFVLEERFGEPRFGLDAGEAKPGVTPADELAWVDLANPLDLESIDLDRCNPPRPDPEATKPPTWGVGGDAAQMAAILFREPSRVYFHAQAMLQGTEP
jgi:hypothetical protein